MTSIFGVKLCKLSPSRAFIRTKQSNLSKLFLTTLGELFVREPRRSGSVIKGVAAIKLQRLEAPHSIVAGQPLTLKCYPDAKRDKLQSLSWYKNGREFYRYQPYDRIRSVLVFNLTGINVDLSRSRNHTVVLTNTTSDSEGRYKCEVTGVSFQEAHMETYIKVASASSSASASIIVRLETILAYSIVMLHYILYNYHTGQ